MPAFDIQAELAAISRALDDHGVEHAICGALALAVHGYPRATKDIDVLIPTGAVAPAKTILRGLGYGLAAAPMTFRSGITVHRVSRVESKDLLTVDLILAEGPLERALDDKVSVPWGERTLWVVSRATLVAMKRLAARAQDAADLEALGEGDD